MVTFDWKYDNVVVEVQNLNENKIYIAKIAIIRKQIKLIYTIVKEDLLL